MSKSTQKPNQLFQALRSTQAPATAAAELSRRAAQAKGRWPLLNAMQSSALPEAIADGAKESRRSSHASVARAPLPAADPLTSGLGAALGRFRVAAAPAHPHSTDGDDFAAELPMRPQPGRRGSVDRPEGKRPVSGAAQPASSADDFDEEIDDLPQPVQARSKGLGRDQVESRPKPKRQSPFARPEPPAAPEREQQPIVSRSARGALKSMFARSAGAPGDGRLR